MMDDYIKDIMEQYSKTEIIDLCTELDMMVDDSVKFKDVLELLLEDLEREGIPESDECSDLMSDFLFVAGFTDEDGNLIEVDEVEEEEEGERNPKLVPDAVEDTGIPEDKLPDCYGFHDDRDPACRKCKVKISCENERVKTRPQCFGELYHKNNVQCQQCIERTFCKEVMNG